MGIVEPKLRIWPSKYGLPSFDTASIMALTYAKINDINLDVQVGSVPQWTPIPSLEHGKVLVTSSSEILEILKSQVSYETYLICVCDYQAKYCFRTARLHLF